MNTTLTINLAGSAFYIDENAYSTLKNYLQSIEQNLGGGTDKKDVMHDIELRIAELFTDMRRQKHLDVVTIGMVRAVMEQLGKPDDFKEETEVNQVAEGPKQFYHRKLYRDTDKQIMGGVCAGLGHWLGIDAIWVRLIFILCLLLWGVTLPIYIILWLIIPEARTAAQRLDMRGEEPTVENIEKEVEQLRSRPESSGSGCLGTGLKIIVWCIAGFFLLMAGSIFYALFAGAMTLLPFGFLGIFFTHGNWAAAVLAILIVMVIGIPVFAIVYAIVKSIRQGESISGKVMWTCLVLWLMAAVGSVVLGIYEIATNEEVQQTLIDPDGYGLWDEDESGAAPSALKLGGFHSVVINGVGNITITQAEEQYVTTDASMHKGFSAEVKDSTLTVNMGKGSGRMWIQIPQLRSVTAEDASSIKTQGTLTCEDLKLLAEGASRMSMNVNAEAVTASANGASKIELSGNTNRLDVSANGASKVYTEKMSANIVEAEVSGASKVKVNATDSLKADASSMGKIRYKGTPFVQKTISSGGSIKQDTTESN